MSRKRDFLPIQNLRELERAGIILRQVYAEVPPKVEYSLTPLGQSLNAVLLSLENWGKNYQKGLTKQGVSISSLDA